MGFRLCFVLEAMPGSCGLGFKGLGSWGLGFRVGSWGFASCWGLVLWPNWVYV